MPLALLSGTQLAATIKQQLSADVQRLQQAHGLQPCLATVLVGEDPASQIYVQSKIKQCKEIGMRSLSITLEADCSEQQLIEQVQELNHDSEVDGILVQMPLPRGLSEQAVINAIDPRKDVDGFHTTNVGRLQVGLESLVPCTPNGCIRLIQSYKKDLSGLHCVVIGRSNIVGKPVAALLLAQSATVTVAHSKTRDLAALCAQADVLIAAVGRPELVRKHWVKPGAIVIDVGINRRVVHGKKSIVGDVAFDEVATQAAAMTPVPGGVGPMTICCLLENTLKACKLNRASH